jgi:hypothetical protein
MLYWLKKQLKNWKVYRDQLKQNKYKQIVSENHPADGPENSISI